jgi:hypothetical protein
MTSSGTGAAEGDGWRARGCIQPGCGTPQRARGLLDLGFGWNGAFDDELGRDTRAPGHETAM